MNETCPVVQLECVFEVLFDLDNAFSSARFDSTVNLAAMDSALESAHGRFWQPPRTRLRGVRFLVKHREELKAALSAVPSEAESVIDEVESGDQRELIREIILAAGHETEALDAMLASVTNLAMLVDDHFCVSSLGDRTKLEQLRKLRDAAVAAGDLESCRRYLDCANRHLNRLKDCWATPFEEPLDLDELQLSVDRIEVAVLQQEILGER